MRKRNHLICNHGCFRHSAAVARKSGSNSSIGVKKSANSRASLADQSYFSIKTAHNPHGFKPVMCFNSPFLLKNNRECFPERAIRRGISPRSSII